MLAVIASLAPALIETAITTIATIHSTTITTPAPQLQPMEARDKFLLDSSSLTSDA